MKRFHVHLHVEDLDRNIAFYSAMFGAEPTRRESDYAKWMLEDPRLNFAISTRGSAAPGLDHLGLQVDEPSELAELKARAEAADLSLVDEGETTCCYARSDKHWIPDPQGIAWEHFHSLASIPVFREAPATAAEAPAGESACCAPAAPSAAASASASACAAPRPAPATPSPAACCPPASPAPAEAGSACCAPAPAAPVRLSARIPVRGR